MAGAWKKLNKSLSRRFSLQRSDSASQISSSDLSSETPASSSLESRSSSFTSRLARSISSRTFTKTCAICLGDLKSGKGQAIFTAECSHSFHFSCIASSVRHGNHLCPICRSKWKEIPFQAPINSGNVAGCAGVSPHAPAIRPSQSQSRREPHHFSDDEPLPAISADLSAPSSNSSPRVVTIKAIPEFPALSALGSSPKFAVVVGIHAPQLQDDAHHLGRAPIDLVAVLDVSGSMGGSKLSLLKRAVCFVIQNLGPLDRIAIVCFSSTARRIFPLRRMTLRGQEDAILAINSLSASGGTNIVEGLKKGVRVLEERREKNPVASIVLLSDGRDSYHYDNNIQQANAQNQSSSNPRQVEYLNQLPASICSGNNVSGRDSQLPIIPVHTFGIGSDHDANVMHDISNASGGMFSFIDSIDILQDAFARCIGGLLSVIAQELRLTVKSKSVGVHIGSIASGRYSSEISNEGQGGVIDIGDLYADEEKEFLVYLSIPTSVAVEGEEGAEKTPLLDVMCLYKDPLSDEMHQVESEGVEIRRPMVLSASDTIVSLEVDRQRNRLLVSQGIAEAQCLAEMGNLDGAQSVLAQQRSALLSSASAQAGDALCSWLEAELREIRERMATQELYEHTGRAYTLSGLSSHFWQRATTRGEMFFSDDGTTSRTTGTVSYDTPSMTSMVMKSQTLNLAHAEQAQRLCKSCSLTPRSE